MRNKKNILFATIALTLISGFTYVISQTKPTTEPKIIQDTVKNVKPTIIPLPDSVFTDKGLKLRPYKKNAHASYYSDKFNGKRTANGSRFNNNSYTAAHKKLKFGTKVKVTNPRNGKSVVVTVNDRGPFVSGREIDLSKRAFNEIADGRKSGFLMVNLEIVE